MDVDGDDIIVCDSCEMMQFIKNTKKSIAAKFTVETRRGEVQDIWAYDSPLFKILGSECVPVTKKGLLKSKPFSMYFQHGHVKYVVRK